MSLRKNDALRNSEANAFGALFNSGKLQIRTGAQPADPDSAASGTLLCEIDLPAAPFNGSSGGVITKLGTWSAISVASGVAGWARFISSDTLKTFDVSVAESAADMIIDDEDVVSGGVVTVTSFNFSVPDGV